MGNLGKRVTSEIFATTLLQGLAFTIDLIFTAILSRLLTPADYGTVAAALLFLAFCDLMREVGIGATIIQLPKLSVIDQRTAVTLMFVISIVIFGIAQLGAAPFAGFMRNPAVESVLRVLAFVIIIQSISTVSQGLLLRDLKVRRVMQAEVGARFLAYSIAGIGMAVAGYGYWALVGASLCESFLCMIALASMARPVLKPQIDKASAKHLLSLGTGFAASRIVNFIALKADVTIVGRYLDAASLGLYSRAYKLMSMPTDLYSKIADRVVFPAMAKVQLEPVRLRSAYTRGISLTSLFGLPMTVTLLLLSSDIIAVFLGPRWGAVVPIFTALAVGTYFRLSARVSSSLLRATGSIPQMVSAQFFYAVLTVGGCLFAVRYGVVAVGAAVGIAITLWFVFTTVLACRIVGVSFMAFLRLQKNGAILAAITGVAVLAAKLLIGVFFVSSFVVLAGVMLEMALIGAVLIVRSPVWIVGTDGKELISHLRAAIANLRSRRTEDGNPHIV
jgi:O-antigen/teichoic acid export membrane protein